MAYKSSVPRVWRSIIVGLMVVVCVVGAAGCQVSGDTPPREEQEVFMFVRQKLSTALQLQYLWGSGTVSDAIKAQKDHVWTDVVAVEDTGHDVGFPETVCVIYPSDDAGGIIRAFNWAIEDTNSDDDPGNDVDPGEFGLSYPLTVDMMWLHFVELGELFNHVPNHLSITDGWG